MKTRGRKQLMLLAAMIAAYGMSCSRVVGQAPARTMTRAELLNAAQQSTDAKYKAFAKHWQERLSSLGTQSRFRRMAKDIIAFDEKVAQGIELVEGKSEVLDRMRASFRKRVVDERALVTEMVDSLAKFQQGLIAESTDLYVKAGVDRQVASSIFAPYRIDGRSWLTAFDPLLRKAEVLSKQDWVRAGGVQVGSYFGGEGLADAARHTGLWAPEKGSWLDLATQLVADVVVEEALEEITDPSDEFAKQLKVKYVAAKQQLLEGKTGLLKAAKQLSDIHQQTRGRHFASVLKGGQ